MPEASMDLHCRPVPWEDDVRTSGQVAPMKPEAEAVGVQKAAHRHLRRGIFTPDPAHVQATLLRRKPIRHPVRRSA